MKAKATYALCGNREGEETTLFLGNGTLLQTSGITIRSDAPANVLLQHRQDGWYYTASAGCTLTINGKSYRVKAAEKMERLDE